ncbi:MAG: hypothetical protein R3B39_01410 [Candidatus Paceibacterota bacterium]
MEHFNINKKLHTDVLESKYGPIHSEIVRHDGFMRESFLSDSTGIARTYALTIFEYDKGNKEISIIDDKIKSGGLIGKVFKDFGFEVRKNVTGVFLIENPDWLKNKFKDQDLKSKARLSEFYAKQETGYPIIYGTVLEVYSPDFRPSEINDVDISQIHPTTDVLEQAGYTKLEIYDFLAEDKDFDRNDERYKKAEEFMKLFPDPTKQKFINYIKSRK